MFHLFIYFSQRNTFPVIYVCKSDEKEKNCIGSRRVRVALGSNNSYSLVRDHFPGIGSKLLGKKLARNESHVISFLASPGVKSKCLFINSFGESILPQ